MNYRTRKFCDQLPRRATEADETLNVFPDRPRDVYPAVGVLDPHDRQAADREAGILGRDEQLRVEEPVLILDKRQQRPNAFHADRLEAALGVVEEGQGRGGPTPDIIPKKGCFRKAAVDQPGEISYP